MGAQQTNKSSSESNPAKPGQINFTLKVAATDLPLKDPNFKMKLILDFGPEFNGDLTSQNTGPNFSAKRVRSILRFVSEDVIRKIVEFIYYKNFYNINGQPSKLINDKAINKIYADRRTHINQGKSLKSKPGLRQEEAIIAKIVNNLINDETRVIEMQEKNIATIRFEELSPGNLWANAQTAVNGDMEPPKL